MKSIISNLKYASKNVFFHFKEFLAFFVALYIIQVIFGLIGYSYVYNDSIDYKYANGNDEYHIELRNLNSEQHNAFINDKTYSNRKDDRLFDVIKKNIRNKSSVDNTRYDIFIKFASDDPVSDYKTFNSRYSKLLNEKGDGLYTVEFSDIMSYYSNSATNKWIFIISLVIMTIVALFLMSGLFNYRLNHFRFTYGIYQTFGAGYKKLVTASFWEMMLITLVTIIPSALTAIGFSLYIYRNSGFVFVFEIKVLLLLIVMSLFVSTIAVLAPMKLIAVSTPVKSLAGEDNSNYVVTPKRSSDSLLFKFPLGYVFCSFKRYRRYLIKLILNGVIFGVIYTAGISFSHLYNQHLNYNSPAFNLEFSGVNNFYTDSLKEELLSIEGVKDVQKIEESSANRINSHILLDSSNTNFWSDAFSVDANGGTYDITNSVCYRPLDKYVAEDLNKKYQIDGDIFKCVDSDEYIVLSNGRYNQKVFDLNPGDVVYVATYISNDKFIEMPETGDEYLRQQLEHNKYSYRKYTVGAVINDMPSGSDTPVYLNPVDYSIVARSLPHFYKVEIYLDEHATAESHEAALSKLRTFAERKGGISVMENDSEYRDKLIEKNHYDFVVILSFLALIVLPVFLMFVQILFYLKRDNEMYVMESLGATSRDIRIIYFSDGVIITLISAILYSVFSLLVTYILNRVANFLFVYPGFGFDIPWFAFIFGLVITAISSMLSSVIPYCSYMKKKKDLLRSVAGEV